MLRVCSGELLPITAKSKLHFPLGMQQDLDLACGKKVWVMGVDVPKQPLSIHASRVMGQIWGTETPAALRISKQSVRADRAYKHADT